MTAGKMITDFDAEMPNQYTDAQKLDWLRQQDGQIIRLCYDTHEAETPIFERYGFDTELLIPFPYREVYKYLLAYKVCLANGEYEKYNNFAILYNGALEDFRNYFNRTNKPKQTKIRL